MATHLVSWSFCRLCLFLFLVGTAVSACQSPPPTSPTPLPPPPTPLVASSTPSPTGPMVNETLTLVGYPIVATATTGSYPAAVTAYPVGETAVFSTPAANVSALNLPFIASFPFTPTPTTAPTEPSVPTPTPIPVVDFAAVRADLQANGQDLAYVKIGFHVGIGGNSTGLDIWMQQLDRAGVPFFLKSADNAQPLYYAQQLMQASGVPHTLVYRRASGNYEYDVPAYQLSPSDAALLHWQEHIAVWPPELDPSLVWMETMNELDRTRADWLAEFSLVTAQLALESGRKWAAFGWASGEPESAHWQSPAMLQFLRLVGEHPDQLAIAVHEYSYTIDNIADGYPFKIGRFLELFRICDQYGIPRPTLLITEWGWSYEQVPSPERALQDIAWASRLYAPYPQVKGAGLWYLGGGYGDISQLAQKIIDPLMFYTLANYFAVPPAWQPVSPDAEQYRP